MRIVAGKYRGKKLAAPEGESTRPTSDRARESVFNILEARLRKASKTWQEITVFDAFSGTGALGLEALSRGATVLFAAEKDRHALACFQENAAAFQKDGCKITIFSDALALPKATGPISLLFMDPPYRKGLVAPALEELKNQGWITHETVCVIEIERGEKDVLPPSFEFTDTRIYGKAEILFVQVLPT